ncbi:MAG: hypothetical protein WAX79_01445 [Candidatus Omnitrophota bacterium]
MFKIKNTKSLIILLLTGITIFSVYKYVVSLKDNLGLAKQLNQIKEQAFVLEQEKQNLLESLEKEKAWGKKLEHEGYGLKNSLRAKEEKVQDLINDFSQTQKVIDDLGVQISSLKTEKEQLKADLSKVSRENENFRSKLSSIEELKKAMLELKEQVTKVKKEVRQKINIEKLSEGNRGFVIRDGKPTFSAKVRIEVNPAITK